MKPVDLVIEFAKSYLGIGEGSQKHSEIINLYNKARYSDAYQMTLADPWCCAFVVGMFQAAGVPDIVPGYAYCDGMIQTFRQWGRWKNRIGYTPQKGDVIFYDWNGDGSSDHVGIVTDYSFAQVTVIEGNKSDAVDYRKIGADSPQIIGYGVPNYGNSDGNHPSNTVCNLDSEYIRTLPLLQYTSKGVYVKILQVLLNYYNNANLDIDGDFGPCTKSAVADYQTKYSLEVDGIAGRETWTHLLTKQ